MQTISTRNATTVATVPGDLIDRPTVFLFPGLSGDESEVAALRANCGASINFVLINYPDWTGIHGHAINLDALIAHCIAQVQTDDQATPPLLAGYSFGGHMAFAVSAALANMGRAVGVLGLLDTHAVPLLWTEHYSVTKQLWHLHAAIREGQMTARIGHILAKMMMRSRSEWPLRSFARFRNLRTPLGISQHINRTLQMQFRLVLLRALLDKMAASEAPLDFHAVLFRCIDQPPNTADDLGWGRHLARLKIETVAGTHFSLMDGQNIGSLCDSFVFAMKNYQI